VKKTSAALLAIPLAASLLLTACGGDTQPTASAPTTPSAAPKTPAGAEAFTRYFYSQLNRAWSKPQAGLISSLSATTCKTCAAFEGSAVDLATKQQHYQGDVFAVTTAASVGQSEILVVGQQPPGAVIDSKGAVVRRKTQAQKSKFIVAVQWSSGGWRINEIKVLK